MKSYESSLVLPDGTIRFGIYDKPISRINYLDYDFRTPMGRKISLAEKWAGFNQFQYFGIISDDLLFGCAISNIRFIGVAFMYLYQPSTQRLIEYSYKQPLALGTRFSQSATHGTSRFSGKKVNVEMTSVLNPAEKHLKVQLGEELQADVFFSEAEPPFHPMSICTRAGYNGWVYAQKVAGVAVQGKLSCALGEYDFAETEAYAHHDFSAGFMRRETFWNWACFSGALSDGTRLGLNVSCGVNETSYTENCLWVNGELIKVDLVRFDFDRNDIHSLWNIHSNDGQVDLIFYPEGFHAEKVNAVLAASNFKQFFGRFSGELNLRNQTFEITDMPGFVEDHYAKW
ncbi:MAG: DUF2804 domain-containing protein [SAR324 cluster bacterium]|nr:DUF2804 domain-containing protein [SAR324 cluster bacterium]